MLKGQTDELVVLEVVPAETEEDCEGVAVVTPELVDDELDTTTGRMMKLSKYSVLHKWSATQSKIKEVLRKLHGDRTLQLLL